VSDAALLLAAIAERSGSDLARAAGARESVAGLRIGVLRDYSGAGRAAAVEAAYTESLQRLAAAGAELVDPLAVRLGSGIGAAEFAILLFEFRDELGQYLAGVRNGPRSLAALIEFNEAHAADVMPHFGQELLLAAAAQAGLEDPGYRAALAAATELRTGLDRLFAAHNLDALIAPANGRAWRTDWRAGDAVRVSSSSIAAVSGYPSVVVPATLSADLPLGMAFIGRPGQEAELIALAAAFERRRGEFPAPKFLPSIGE
jgi:amidase